MNLSLLLLRLRAVLLLVLAACALPALAQQTTRQVSLPNQDYTESTVDLAVKVLGGVVEIRRTWTWGRWYLNDKWADLQLQPDALGGIKSISRAGRVYSRQGAHGDAFRLNRHCMYRTQQRPLSRAFPLTLPSPPAEPLRGTRGRGESFCAAAGFHS